MSAKQKELERLLELKKKQEEQQVLNQKDMLERIKLENKYMEFLQMTSQQMEEELKKRGPVKEVDVKGKDIDPIIADYKKLYSKESWYKEPETKDGKTHLTFPSQEAAGTFFRDQAEKNRSFIVIDATTNKVLAYSNGDGKLYNGNGSLYQGGDFKASKEDFTSFKMPEREDPKMGMQL
ncbi:TPA: Dot/Icm T4SS effector CegC4 [Legionella pneumophila]